MQPKYITVHCSATPPSNYHVGVEVIRGMHLKRGFSDIGYHQVIMRSGQIADGRPLKKQGAGVKGHNKNNIHICLVGGVDENNTPTNNFTSQQFAALRYLITDLASSFGIKQENIKGHRDWFSDLNGDGIIDKQDWLKECPCFDVQSKLEEWKK